MKIVLQHTQTLLYFQSPGTWIADIGSAFDFGHSQKALEFAQENNLAGLQVVVAFIEDNTLDTIPFSFEAATLSRQPGTHSPRVKTP